MAAEATKTGFKYPYLPFTTFTTLLTKMEKEGGVPDRVDRTYLKYTSGVMQSYLIATLKAFGLIDQNNYKTAALDQLVNNPDKRPELIRGLLEKHYQKQLSLGPNATEGMLSETFDTLTGETKRKAITFFLHAAKYADIKLSPHFKAPRPSRSGASKGKKRDRGSGHSGEETPPPPPADVAGDSHSVTLASGTTVTLSVSKRLLTLPRDERDFVLGLVDQMQEQDAPSGSDADEEGGQI